MKVALGLKAHSGWAALVALGWRDGAIEVSDRRRVDLVEEEWAKQPYHAAEGLKPAAARETVARGIEAANRMALEQLRAAVRRERERDNRVEACAVLMGNPMPAWSVEEILAVHFRMHKAEGALFRDALARAVESCGLPLVAIGEKSLKQHAATALGPTGRALIGKIESLGRAVGPPWGRDQKDAALSALIALQGRP